MLTKEADILYLFAREPWRKYNFTELRKVSGKKSRSYLAGVLGKLAAAGLLKREPFGRLPVYSLDSASMKARVFAGFVLENFGWGKRRVPYADLQKLMDRMPYRDYAFLVTGSYASGKQTERSDIDVIILIGDTARPKRVYAELSHCCELNVPPVHLYVFRYGEFVKMLCDREGNYGKEAAKNSLVLAGGQVYVGLLQEAVLNGYHG
jgi:DNA-binding HxlR family transcriptional regulator